MMDRSEREKLCVLCLSAADLRSSIPEIQADFCASMLFGCLRNSRCRATVVEDSWMDLSGA